jgi:hypothetical protein
MAFECYQENGALGGEVFACALATKKVAYPDNSPPGGGNERKMHGTLEEQNLATSSYKIMVGTM